jgi:asparagine synthase (glutamine-hydrolysing)
MCGIAVVSGTTNPRIVNGMMARMRHRGPDGKGTRRCGRTVLGHVRLAILDVAGGVQPMANERGDLTLTFNGEIYNHLDFRHKLEERHIFKTRSDSEVLLHLYEEESEDMLDQLDGMFAFALAGPHGLLLARDPLGIKPLYTGRRGDMFMAASELKAFPRMDELHMLPAGHALLAGEKEWRYARPFPPERPIVRPPLSEALAEVRRRFEEAVVKRLMSDVPVGVFLSGGLDSSLVAAIMRPHTVRLHSFTAGMKGSPDLQAAAAAAKFLGTEHHELVYTAADVHKAIPDVVRSMESFDAPLIRSAVPMYFISKLAAEHVKVVLSGEGADELFAGYEYLRRLGGGERLKKELADITVRLQDTNLQRADRISMAFGLEARVPFLDLGLVRYASRLPPEWLEPRPGRPEKWLLRQACRGLLPTEIEQRKKMKFSEGAGSAEVIADLVESSISRGEFRKTQRAEPELRLRSPEELYYYRIWRDAMGRDISPSLVGRTLDRSAAAIKEHREKPRAGERNQE